MSREARKTSLRGRLLLTMSATALLVAAACNGGGPSPNGNGGAGDELPQGNAAEQLTAFGERWAETDARVAYDVTTSGPDAGAPGRFVLYWSPPDRWRMDILSEGETAILIGSPQGTFLCGGAGEEAGCLLFPPEQAGAAAGAPFAELFSDPEALQQQIETSLGGAEVQTSERTIGGVQGFCYTAAGEVEGEAGAAEWCFSESGVPLLIAAESATEGSFRMEATEVSTEVSDSDFEPPYPVTEIPTGMPGS
ncbi:MAG: hypothetical protein HY658_03560 [Actinobacteria bacterium]|nr:hypothetical protein [Actinomycetota bacterium]